MESSPPQQQEPFEASRVPSPPQRAELRVSTEQVAMHATALRPAREDTTRERGGAAVVSNRTSTRAEARHPSPPHGSPLDEGTHCAEPDPAKLSIEELVHLVAELRDQLALTEAHNRFLETQLQIRDLDHSPDAQKPPAPSPSLPSSPSSHVSTPKTFESATNTPTPRCRSAQAESPLGAGASLHGVIPPRLTSSVEHAVQKKKESRELEALTARLRDVRVENARRDLTLVGKLESLEGLMRRQRGGENGMQSALEQYRRACEVESAVLAGTRDSMQLLLDRIDLQRRLLFQGKGGLERGGD